MAPKQKNGKDKGKERGNGQNQIELLAPAKNMMAVKASAPYADAVYFGVEEFNMRMKSENFSLSTLPKIVQACHFPTNPAHRKRKVYLTLNILIYENELDALARTITAAKEAKVDAVIVHDIAGIQLAKRIGIPFHISTQCNVSNSESAKFYESLGAERIILARECSLQQIKVISSKMGTAEIETFVHGAMCSSISGRCYLSQTIACTANKSANRGVCTQPCRGTWSIKHESGTEFLYDGLRILNSRDLCMINYIPQLVEAGIKSFKIEGRMRHPHYVDTVTRVYREAIDAYYAGEFQAKLKTQGWITQLKRVYNRGFTTGFFFQRASEQDSQLRSPANISHYRYIKMGTIIHSYPTKVVKIQLTNGTLRVGDEVIVMSTKSRAGGETYFTQKIRDIRLNNTDVMQTSQATQQSPIEISTKLDEITSLDSGDAIFKFTDETYKNRKKSGKKSRAYNLK
ncbi:MAG: peptidase U32 family protein [Promethearchaeota archaeon]